MSDRTYEILFIVDPNLTEAEVETLATTVQGFVEKEGGRVTKNEKWGKKRLAYSIGRHREGSYVLLTAEGPGQAIKEVERRIRVIDGIIRFITVRIDEDLKKADRRKAQRAAGDEKRRGKGGERRPAPVSVVSSSSEVVSSSEEQGVQR